MIMIMTDSIASYKILWLSFLMSISMATPLTIGSCKTDQDCSSFTLRLHQLPTGSSQVSHSGYLCINETCSYVVSAGSVCRKASDCSQHSFLSNAIKSNRSDLLPAGYNFESIGSFMETLCSPQYCSISSSCDYNYMPYYQSGLTSTGSCCSGIALNDPCLQSGTLVSTCNENLACNPSLDINSNALMCAVTSPPVSTQWIGIILTLIAAALTNLGLNLQKLALRKRHEKVVKKKEHERLGLFYRLTNLKVSVSKFYRSVSNSSLPKFPSLMANNKEQVERNPTHTESKATDNEEAPNQNLTQGQMTPSSSHTISPSTRTVGQVKTVSTSDKDQFQSKLGMANLAKNPRWWLGFIVFALGNFTNFAALNFAAQSLIGPLGSFSLVCNVIIAPLMNGERWTWKDIVGVMLIVCGSAVVVIFSGSAQPDYNACVLLKLFQKTATEIFLIFTCTAVFLIFCFIIVLEKNLDFKDTSVVVIAETFESGELVNIETNPNSSKLADSTSPENIESKRRSGVNNNNRAKRVSMIISDQVAEDGSNLRIVTINAKDGNERNEDSDSEESSDDATQDVGVGPSTHLSNAEKKRKLSLASLKSQIIDSDGNAIQSLFNRKTGEGASVHSVALTFKLAPPSPHGTSPAIDLESNSSIAHAPEKLEYQAPNGETVVVLPSPRTKRTTNLWMTRLIEYSRTFWIIEKIYQLKLIPRFKSKIPLDSPYVRIGLPFAYATIGGLMATLLTLFAKATIYLITGSFQGDNQFTSFPAYLFTSITLFCAVSQIYWINLGLARYDALLQIPVFYVVWTLFDVIGGGVYYGEFDGFTPAKYGLFSLGVGIIFLGVGILATRLASIADEEKGLTRV